VIRFITQQIEDSIAAKKVLLETGAVRQIQKAAALFRDCLKKGNTILFFGNGGSAADCQHLAAELVGRFKKKRGALSAIALTTDTSVLTAIGNDYGFEHIFERQLEALGRRGDLAVAISTSGNSHDVLLGIKRAKRMGIFTIGLGGSKGGKMKSMVDLSIVAPFEHTARIQECHILIGHILCACVDERF
jgi:D-sedoheptulose 7-phosphate isomerase